MNNRIAAPVLALTLGACTLPPSNAGETLDGSGSTSTATTGDSDPSASGNGEVTGSPTTSGNDTGTETGEPGCTPGKGERGCSRELDVLIVVDNSAQMGHEQLRLARAMPSLVERFSNATTADGTPLDLDVQIMVTTTDMGSPLCDGFNPPGYTPAAGSPTLTACTERLDDFTGLDGMTILPEACTDACPTGVAATGNFVAFDATGSNVPAGPDIDIDGDGVLDPPVAQALACLVPQGINGCGYEAPLESMLQALSPLAAWNTGPQAFLRADAALAVVLMTDEYDCSLANPAPLLNADNYNVSPASGAPQLSSAACWNAGVDCVDANDDGIYESCVPSRDPGFHPIERYTDFLTTDLEQMLGKEVAMLQLVGVPSVTAHAADPPFEPAAGGVDALVYRDWIDFPFPAGDIDPAEWDQGINGAQKQFEWGIGPGCTGLGG